MGFWIRNILFGSILVVLAYLFFVNQDLLTSLGQSSEKMSPAMATPKDMSPAKKHMKEEKKENSAAKGLSKFYANINASTDVDKPTIRKNIVYLPAPKGDLELLLSERRRIVRSYPKNWKGTTKSRPFRLSETLHGKFSEYAKEDKLKVFWRLNRDYVVKDAFRINKNILKTALQLGQAINGHFQNGVSVYFCYQSRSLVFIEGAKSYLDERCILLKRNTNY